MVLLVWFVFGLFSFFLLGCQNFWVRGLNEKYCCFSLFPWRMSPAYTVPLMETTHSRVGQVITQNFSVEMVSNVDQLVAGTSSYFSYFALFISWLNNTLLCLVFTFIILQTVRNSLLSQCRKAEVIWILGFLRNWFFLGLHNLCWGFDSCCNHAVRKICMIMSPTQHSWRGTLLQYGNVVVQLLFLFTFHFHWHNALWNLEAYQKRILTVEGINAVRYVKLF